MAHTVQFQYQLVVRFTRSNIAVLLLHFVLFQRPPSPLRRLVSSVSSRDLRAPLAPCAWPVHSPPSPPLPPPSPQASAAVPARQAARKSHRKKKKEKKETPRAASRSRIAHCSAWAAQNRATKWEEHGATQFEIRVDYVVCHFVFMGVQTVSTASRNQGRLYGASFCVYERANR
ncbi:hypothetical protein R5R35_002187 [Gryllus longicercus]|uniref:Uncharacterized protein n=1 Tax=Gryllus longicercus TaxID=2509291 RepID=A0AAN9VF62_9ORTH